MRAGTWQSRILDVRYYSGAAAKVRKRPSVSKRATQKYDMERFSPEKLSYVEVRDQYKVKTSNRVAASENLDSSKNINRALRNVKENVTGKSLRYYEQQRHKIVG